MTPNAAPARNQPWACCLGNRTKGFCRAPRHLATAYSHAALRENMVSLVSKLEFCWIVIGRLDKPFRDKLIQNSPLMGFEIRAGASQQIAKDRNF
jgi:hypothetical protein